MKPTPKLRFIEREMLFDGGTGKPYAQTVRVLQQWWEPTDEPYEEWLNIKEGKWLDVPLEEEV